MSREGFPTSERAYAAVKQDLFDGRYRPGARIDAALLADRHGTSITPIRTALHRLAGERLVESRPSEGFFRSPLSEAGLRELYIWNGHILTLAMRLWPRGLSPPANSAESPVDDTAALFHAIAALSRNEHCVSAVTALNDQLHVVRRVEAAALTGIDAELEDLATLVARQATIPLRRALARYHLRRIRAAADLVRLAHQDHRP